MEPELEDHEILRDCATHISQAECEVRNALRAALDEAEPSWVLERLGRLSRELIEVYSIVVVPLVPDEQPDPDPARRDSEGAG
jgi:hypothetical protein